MRTLLIRHDCGKRERPFISWAGVPAEAEHHWEYYFRRSPYSVRRRLRRMILIGGAVLLLWVTLRKPRQFANEWELAT